MKQSKRLLVLGILAALISAWADVLLLYVPQGGYENGDYLFLTQISEQRMFWGHLLGILGIPFIFPAVWQITRWLAPGGKHLPDIALFIVSTVLVWGVTYHGQLIWVRREAIAHGDVHQVIGYFEWMGSLMAIIFSIAAIFFSRQIYLGRTALPRSLWWWNPILFYLIFVGLYLISPAIGGVPLVAGFNLSLAIYFSGYLRMA